jgi:hypothetical protein
MTASGLRREASRGLLAIERVAGKDYTTLAAIENMRDYVPLGFRSSGRSQRRAPFAGRGTFSFLPSRLLAST